MKKTPLIVTVLGMLYLISPDLLFSQETVSNQAIKPDDITAARNIRRAQLEDPFRPAWHLTIAEGTGFPFDPNDTIFKD